MKKAQADKRLYRRTLLILVGLIIIVATGAAAIQLISGKPQIESGIICSEYCEDSSVRDYYVGVTDADECSKLNGHIEVTSDHFGKQERYCLVGR